MTGARHRPVTSVRRRPSRPWGWLLALALPVLAGPGAFPAARAADDVYQKPSTFIRETFGDKIPPAGLLTLTDKDQEAIKGFMGNPHPSSRVRYWSDGTRTAWILNEIGKTKPITTGYVVKDGRIERVKVLIYRESHGWEVRQPFFTRQFKGAQLGEDFRLDQRIDNIAGATLSVQALTDMAKLALYLERKRVGR